MKKTKKTVLFLLAGILASNPLFFTGQGDAFAASPPFARTEEEWATLADNKLEYSEIAGLIHEYNATVLQNQIDYRKFRKDYGDSKDDVTNAYRELADEILNNIDYPDPTDANYASAMVAILSNETTANNLQSTADNNLEDSSIYLLNYESAEKSLVEVAQNNMIAYYNNQLDIEKATINRDQLALALSVIQTQALLGTATQMEVLSAQESCLSAQQAITTAQSAFDTTKQKLQIMCGWSYDATPEFGILPALDLTRIDAMNPSADLNRALENNYTLQVNQKKLANSNSQTQTDSLTSTIASNRENIASSLTTAYQNVIAARDAHTYAISNAEFQNQTLATVNQRYSLGMVSRLEKQNQEFAVRIADIARQQAELNLFQAMEAYDWAVNGLAGA